MDKPIETLLRYEWKSFFRNRLQLLMLFVMLLFGLYAIYSGQSEIIAQRETIQAVQALEQEEFAKYKASFDEEMRSLEEEQVHDIASRPAFAWFRHAYHAIIPPQDYASLAIGQRDLFRYYYRLTGMSLHYQLFENEIANPVNLLIGNFDLSFVLVYLFPLLIIAFCYGLFSSEKENGTLALLQIQPLGLRKIILVRLGFHMVMLIGLALLISLAGLLIAGNPFKTENLVPAIAWMSGVLVYCGFWFALMFLIVSFRKNSSFNALTAVAGWLLFLIVIPSILNVFVTTKYPLNSATLAGLTRRTGLENDDQEEVQREVIMEYLAHKPALAGSDSLIKDNMAAKAYAAFTSLKDIDSQGEVDHYNDQVVKRNKWTASFNWLSPAVNMQDMLAHVAETDVNTFLHFQASLIDFHEDITDFYFTRLFWGKPILLDDYAKLPTYKEQEVKGRWKTVWLGLGKIAIAAVLAFLFGYHNFNRNHS